MQLTKSLDKAPGGASPQYNISKELIMFAITKNIINLTPHTLNIHTNNGAVLNLPPSGTVARVATSKTVAFHLDTGNGDTFPNVWDVTFGDVTGLPPVTDGVFLIVSRLVKSAVPHRRDVLVPGTPIRDDKGVIIGADGFDL